MLKRIWVVLKSHHIKLDMEKMLSFRSRLKQPYRISWAALTSIKQ